MNPTEKENLRKKVMTPSVKNNLQLGSRVHNNAGLGSKVQKQSYTVSKFHLNKPRPKETVIPTQANEMTVRNENLSAGKKHSQGKERIKSQHESLNNTLNTTNTLSIPVMGEKTKRKFTEIQREKEEAKKASQSLLEQFSVIYEDDKALQDNELFIKKFSENLETSGVINFSQLLPQSLDQYGSCLLEHSKFFLSFIKFKALTDAYSAGVQMKFPLEKYVMLFDNCLNYDQNDLKLIYSSFINFVGDNYSKEEILTMIEKRHHEETQKLLNHSSELNESHFKFLLAKPENFLNFELESLKYKPYKEESESKRKKNTIGSAFKSKKIVNMSNLSLLNAVEGLKLSESLVESRIFENEEPEGNLNKEHMNSIEEHPQGESKNLLEESENFLEENLINQSVHSEQVEDIKETNEDDPQEIINECDEPNLQNKYSEASNNIRSEEEEKQEASELEENFEENNTLQDAVMIDQSSFNLVSENRNFIDTCNFPINIEEISPVENQAYNAKVFYTDLINKNKIALEIENVCLSFNKKTPKKLQSLTKVNRKSPYALIDNDRFSIIKPEEEAKIEKEEARKEREDARKEREEARKEREEAEVSESRGRSKKQKKSNIKKEIIEEPLVENPTEEETMVTRSMKNKKRYQSDKKDIKKEESEPEEDPQPEPDENPKKDKKKKDNRRKTKSKPAEKNEKKEESEVEEENKKEKTSRTTKNKNKKKNSVSPSGKASEVEEEIPRGRSSLRNDKNKNKNKKKVSASPSAKESEEEEEERKPKRENRRVSRKEKSKTRNAEKSRKKAK